MLGSGGASEKLAAGVGIREAGEGYHQVTMATVSLASPSLTRPAPTNWSALTGAVTNCFSMWQTLPTGVWREGGLYSFTSTEAFAGTRPPLSPVSPPGRRVEGGQGLPMRKGKTERVSCLGSSQVSETPPIWADRGRR